MTLGQVRAGLRGLSRSEFDVVARGVYGLRDDHATVDRVTLLGIALAEWLASVGVEDAGRRVILRKLRAASAAVPDKVVLADHRYVTWDDRTGWFDYQFEEEVADLPCGRPVTLIACNVPALEARTAFRVTSPQES